MDLDMKYETSWPSQAIWNVQYLFLCDKTSNKIEHSKKDSLCQTDLCHNITTSPSEMNLNYSHSWLWNPTAKHIVDGRKPANHLRLLVYPRYFKTSINRPESPRGASVHWKFVPRQVETLRHLDQKTVEASKKSTWFFSGRVIVFSENRFKTKKCPCFDG